MSVDLSNEKLVHSNWAFYFYLKFKGLTIKEGDYLLPNNLSAAEIATILSDGSHQVKIIRVREGWRMEQIAVYLENNLGIKTDDFLALTKGKEGKLYPDTYKLSDEPTAREVFDKMLENYQAKTAELKITNQTLTFASIIEREAGGEEDRADIAGVFANRLAVGMKLQSNPTTEYQKDTNSYESVGILNYKFWQSLISGDISSVSGPYNTYVVSGLPPAPICSPTVESIKAAISPAKNNYYYFFADSTGKTYFSSTYAEHVAKVEKYLH